VRFLQRVLVVGAIGVVQPTFAGVIGGFEVEPNNSIESADFLGDVPPNDFTFILGSLAPGDVDYFAVDLVESSIVYSFLSGVGLNYPNVLIGIFGSDGSLLTTSQEYSVPGDSQVLIERVSGTGTYYLAVSALNDVGFVGDHEFSFDYVLEIQNLLVPGPGSASVIVAMGLLPKYGRRRRHW